MSDMEYSNRSKKTRRETSLETIDAIIAWERLCALIEPQYYRNNTGRPPIGIETMLRMYLLQIWFSLSDELTEEGIYDSRAMHDFMELDFLTQ